MNRFHRFICFVLLISSALIFGCNSTIPIKYSNPSGETIETRFLTPDGFFRIETDDYGSYLRGIKLLPNGTKIHKYDGSLAIVQSRHAAVLDIDLDNRDLQQCADSILRLRSEYLWAKGEFDAINFHLTSGDEFPYSMYREGYRLYVENGTDVSLEKTAEFDASYECFRSYLLRLFTYAGTISMEAESKAISLADMKIGDIFVYGGSPGHAMIIIDMCANDAGETLFLLAQGNTPAQQMHVINSETQYSPWFSTSDVTFPFTVGTFTFPDGSLRRMT